MCVWGGGGGGGGRGGRRNKFMGIIGRIRKKTFLSPMG